MWHVATVEHLAAGYACAGLVGPADHRRWPGGSDGQLGHSPTWAVPVDPSWSRRALRSDGGQRPSAGGWRAVPFTEAGCRHHGMDNHPGGVRLVRSDRPPWQQVTENLTRTISLGIGQIRPVNAADRVLGHATASMTMDLYGHLVDGNLRQAARMGGGISGPAELPGQHESMTVQPCHNGMF